jgi:3-phenylpropionate/trans-cinnamate dioxygenase ferredoxin reductase subunit
VAAEPGDPYQRPQLSKEFITAEQEPKPLALRTREHLDRREVEVLSGVQALSIDLSVRRIDLEHGAPLGFEQLVLATGSKNRELKVPGASLGGIHSLRTLDEARRMRNAFQRAHRVVIVGAGFIGLELASAACKLGCEVTVLDIFERPMARVLSAPMSEHFAHAHRSQGVDLRLCEGVT